MIKKFFKRVFYFFLFLILVAGAGGGGFYYFLKMPATSHSQTSNLIIGRDDNLKSVIQRLERDFGLKHPMLFEELAKRMNVQNNIRPGKFAIKSGIGNRELAVLLRKGGTLTVDVVIKGTQDVRKVAPYLGRILEPDEEEFTQIFSDDNFLKEFGFNSKTLPALFIPNTYNMFYFTNSQEVFQKLYQEYQKYWNEERTQKALALGLTPIEISTLASIVDKETNKVDEMPRVAGVYLNRLAANHPLQADPTVKFALDSPSMKRIFEVHTQYEHPYNTYFVNGLPPGPICIPSIQALNAVINAEKHQYFFFCARPDFSGYHNFAVTYDQHLVNRRNYQKFLNANKIK